VDAGVTRRANDHAAPAVLKVLAAGEDAAEQNCGIDRRDLGVPDSFAGIDVGEVKEESAMRRQLPPKKDEGRDDAQARILVGEEAALLRDADCGQAEAGGGHTGQKSALAEHGGPPR